MASLCELLEENLQQHAVSDLDHIIIISISISTIIIIVSIISISVIIP